MKKRKGIMIIIVATMLLTACGNQVIERDAQYQMGDFAVLGNAEFGVSSTEVIADEAGSEQVAVNLTIVNTSTEILYIHDVDLDYYSPASEKSNYTSIENETSLYLLPGAYTLATIYMDYTIDGLYYLSFDNTNNQQEYYALEVKKAEVVEKALPEVVNSANPDLPVDLQKGVAGGLGDLTFIFGDVQSYSWQTNIGGISSDFLQSGLQLTIKNTNSNNVDFSAYKFYEIYTFTDRSVDFDTVSKQLGSEADDVTEIGEISSINANGSVDVVLMLSRPLGSDTKTIQGHYIQIEYRDQKMIYKI